MSQLTSQLIPHDSAPSAGASPAAGPVSAARRAPSVAVLYLTLLSLSAGLLVSAKSWLRAEQPTEDSGESTEKAFMIILGITLGLAVTAAAVLYLKSKTDLFKG